MALILNLETSTHMCSVALAADGKVLAFKELGGEYTHAENLTLFIEDVFTRAGRKMSELDAIAVSKGPGSYTGLRIGVSTAKGICYALEKPLLAIQTLESLMQALPSSFADTTAAYCPMLDARRLEVYCALYDSGGVELEAVKALIVDETAFASRLEHQKMVFFGEGAAKCKALINHPNAQFVNDIVPSAIHMSSLSEKAFQAKRFEDLAYFEPFYLKEFYTGK